ncbi:hypothetical protein P389DRAFT_181346 [Cystobasidium minutum MCA 4210]|uniref:uncharacterized protein n=1 Tax=Cystobasidium minutum MCA 4210 TaxID=1397322 RepID=UPI0034CE8954|eukprot:jgi/Rhomi1/181346/fgenesh1_pg.6_\
MGESHGGARGRDKDRDALRKAAKGVKRDAVLPKKAKYSKAGREQMKEATLKGESWKGKLAMRRMAKQGGQAEGTSSNAQPLGEKPQQPKTGFNVGPRLAKGSYTGKFEKIKAGLIHNAKIKKQYAKMLKREGLVGGSGDAKMDTEEGNTDGDMEAEDLPSIPSKRKGKGRARNPDDMEQDGPSPTKPVLRKRKSSELERDEEHSPDDMDSDDADGPAPGPDLPSTSHIHPSRRDADPEPRHKRPRISEAEIDEKREKRKKDRLAWGKKTRKGQPNLGSRMDVLLGKIERTAQR